MTNYRKQREKHGTDVSKGPEASITPLILSVSQQSHLGKCTHEHTFPSLNTMIDLNKNSNTWLKLCHLDKENQYCSYWYILERQHILHCMKNLLVPLSNSLMLGYQSFLIGNRNSHHNWSRCSKQKLICQKTHLQISAFCDMDITAVMEFTNKNVEEFYILLKVSTSIFQERNCHLSFNGKVVFRKEHAWNEPY